MVAPTVIRLFVHIHTSVSITIDNGCAYYHKALMLAKIKEEAYL